MVRCTNCGNENAPAAQFCAFCGKTLMVVAAPAAQPMAQPQYGPQPYAQQPSMFSNMGMPKMLSFFAMLMVAIGLWIAGIGFFVSAAAIGGGFILMGIGVLIDTFGKLMVK